MRDVAGALGGFATEVFEIRDSARRAAEDTERLSRRQPRLGSSSATSGMTSAIESSTFVAW